jgi:hypothetical protein
MALYVFVDEAGNLRADRDRYSVLVAFVTEQPKATRKCFVRAKQTKLPRQYQHYAELKFSDRVIPDDFKKHVLRQVARNEIRIYVLVVAKEYLASNFSGQAEGMIYCHLVTRLLESCHLAESDEVYLFLDRRSLGGLTRQEFDARLRRQLLTRLRERARLEIQHPDSTTSVNIQVVDFLCGAVFQKYERCNPEYYSLIEDRIVVEEILTGHKIERHLAGCDSTI